MLEIVFDIVENDYTSVISPNIIDDIAGLQRKKNGKIEHSEGGHDDNLFSYLMARYVFCYGTNLSRFRIYKKFNNKVEDMASIGNRSDSEYLSNISSVLNANFNNRRIDGQSSGQQQIMEEWYQQQQRLKEIKEISDFEQGRDNKLNDSIARIFSYNSL